MRNEAPHDLKFSIVLCALGIAFLGVSIASAEVVFCKSWTGSVKVREGSCKSWETLIPSEVKDTLADLDCSKDQIAKYNGIEWVCADNDPMVNVLARAGLVKTVFVTSETYPGDFGGLEVGDENCQRLAEDAGLTGEFKAWLSDNSDSPSTRFIQSPVPYVLVDGTLVANDYQDLTDGTLNGPWIINPISKDEHGAAVESSRVWTGTRTDGLAASARCAEWTSQSGVGVAGSPATTHLFWTGAHSTIVSAIPDCDLLGSLYCFQQ